MLIARDRIALAEGLATLPKRALVPTMGALHEGHLALITAARTERAVVASIFVNPLQFGPGEDFTRYPRDEAGDLAALKAAGCALAFVPDVGALYLAEDATAIEIGGPALGWEGARRPGHFRGVATVVARLLGLIGPEMAWFGEKDWQQLQVVRRMVADLCLPVTIRGLPTVRAADGLALSSRNRYLDPGQRAVAPALARVGARIAATVRAGAGADAAVASGGAELAGLGFAVEYLAVVAAESMVPAADPACAMGERRLIAAARLGGVRLLDNWAI